MVRCMVRLFLEGQREGLAQQRQAHQQEDRQCSPGELTVASRRGWPAAKKQEHTNTMVARSDALRLPEILRPSAVRHDSPALFSLAFIRLPCVPLGVSN